MIRYSDFKKQAGWKEVYESPLVRGAAAGAGIGAAGVGLAHLLGRSSKGLLRNILHGTLLGGVIGASWGLRQPDKNRPKMTIAIGPSEDSWDSSKGNAEEKKNKLTAYLQSCINRLKNSGYERVSSEDLKRIKRDLSIGDIDARIANSILKNRRFEQADWYADEIVDYDGIESLGLFNKVRESLVRKGHNRQVKETGLGRTLPEVEFKPGELNKEQEDALHRVSDLMVFNNKPGSSGMA